MSDIKVLFSSYYISHSPYVQHGVVCHRRLDATGDKVFKNSTKCQNCTFAHLATNSKGEISVRCMAAVTEKKNVELYRSIVLNWKNIK